MIINKDKYEENKNKYNDLCNEQLGGASKDILLGIILFLAFITIKNYIRVYKNISNRSRLLSNNMKRLYNTLK
jgi:hypothetical protein